MAKAILIANLDKTDRKEFEKIFKTPNYHLIFSETENDTLLQAKLFKPDLIITEAKLKEKIGLKLCNTVKKDPELKHIPFILLLNIFEGISEMERETSKVDGVLYKPIQEDEVLDLVEPLMKEEVLRVKEKEISKREMEWKSFADNIRPLPGKKEELLLDEFGEIEEEIIELMDVVEEPEPRMSIHDFVGSGKEEAYGEITPLESWERIEEGKKPYEKGFALFPEEKAIEEVLSPPFKKEIIPPKATSREKLFEKIELREILKKMDQQEPSSRLTTFEEFEAALQKEGEAIGFKEEIEPFFFEKPKMEVPTRVTPGKKSLEEDLKTVSEEEFPEELLEELEEEEISAVDESKEIKAKEIKLDELEPLKSKIFEKKVSPQMQAVEKQMGEVISKRVREMMEDFTTKLVPEVTQNVINLTIERIEKIVRETVPDLAEKAIQEEIKRLQKGEKE